MNRVVVLVLLFAAPAVLADVNIEKGLVPDTVAVVQSGKVKVVNGKAVFSGQVKLKVGGTYKVIAGYYRIKGQTAGWHQGDIVGTAYYGSTTISGDAGDVIFYEIPNIPIPPLNRQHTAGVYYLP